MTHTIRTTASWTKTWEPPVVEPTKPRYFLADEATSSWEELLDEPQSAAFADKLGDGRTLVSVLALGERKFRISADDSYNIDGGCVLEITQPLARALATFGALLVADGMAEADALDLPDIA